jgi:branched-chain amino acid transport system ATP-binding protein
MSSGGLEVRTLCKRFGGIVVADEITLTVPPGVIIGLIGPNGAGKTSFFNLVSGVVAPDRGEVRLNGQPLAGLKPHERARRGLSRTWQNIRLFPSLSVIDNLLIATRIYEGESMLSLLTAPARVKTSEAGNRKLALELLDLTGLLAVAEAEVGNLTYGQQKLVGVARALMNTPSCLLLDEPMAGVEGRAYEAIQNVIKDVAGRGIAVCVVEHNVSFVRDLCHEGVFMFAGKILARAPVDVLMKDPHLTEIYFGG